MGKHLNPLEKEFLIRQYKGSTQKMSDFCEKAHSGDMSTCEKGNV